MESIKEKRIKNRKTYLLKLKKDPERAEAIRLKTNLSRKSRYATPKRLSKFIIEYCKLK